MDDFLRGAKSLASNPLGIIALFIALIYGFATLLLGVAAKHLEVYERVPLVWFVILFPILVLAAFFVLVTKYHVNLYAPADFRSDEAFLKPTLAQLDRKREDDLAELRTPPPPTPADGQDKAARVEQVKEEPREQQTTQELRADLERAEILALRKVSRERKLTVRPHVAIGDQPPVLFDGVAETVSEVIAIEVKLLNGSWTMPKTVTEIMYRASFAQQTLRNKGVTKDLRLLIIFVVRQEKLDRERLSRILQPLLDNTLVKVEWEAVTLSELVKAEGQP